MTFKSILSGLARGIVGEPMPAEENPEPERFRLRGINVTVVNTRPDITTSAVVERLDEALALIEAYQPWRFRHLQRDVREIRIERFACRGAFIPHHQTVITELTFLARRDIHAGPVASSILHEGVHARVRASGFVAQDDGDRAREERLCRKAELAFGMALPPELGAPVIERALESLGLSDEDVAPAVNWAEAEGRIAEVDSRKAG
jgi:hypothetical protein